jgi:hypothetical protein
MRTSVVIAAIGAAAVLGGLVGAGVMRVRTIAGPADSSGSWWCSDDGTTCRRDKGICEVRGGNCAVRRVVYCRAADADIRACRTTLADCQGASALVGMCIGVE